MDNLELPNIREGEFGFEGEIKLEAWSDFKLKQGLLASNSEENQSFQIDLGGDMVEDKPSIKLEHVNAYKYLVEHQENIKSNILSALIKEYPNIQKEYEYEGKEKEKLTPDLKDPNEIKNLIRLSAIHILNIHKEHFAFVGYEFECKWDNEHGLGIMTYKDKILEIGEANTSFLSWIAEKFENI